MIFLNKIVSYLPEERLSLDELKTKLNLDDQQITVFRRYFGLEYVPTAGSKTLPELLETSLARLLSDDSIRKESIRYILYCHTNSAVAPHTVNVLNQLKKKMGLGHAISFGVVHQFCASSITALDIADTLLAGEASDAKAIVLTGELAFHPLVQSIPDTTVLGEASAACLVGKQGAHNKVLSVVQETIGQLTEGRNPSELMQQFRARYPGGLISVVRNAVSMAGIDDSDIALILPHNINSVSWKLFSKYYPLAPSKVYLDNIPRTGHCFTSDPFVNFTSATEDRRIHPGDHIVMVSVGVDDASIGATFVATVIRH